MSKIFYSLKFGFILSLRTKCLDLGPGENIDDQHFLF